MIILPKSHPRRQELHDEAHARPPDALMAPLNLSFLALLNDTADRRTQIEPVLDICRRYGVTPPPQEANHFGADFGDFRLTWERHTEFTRYLFMTDSGATSGESADPFAQPAVQVLSSDWIAGLPGQLLASAHVAHRKMSGAPLSFEKMSELYFGGNALIGAHVAEQAGLAVTDFRIHDDGFSRFLLLDKQLAPRQAGRMVQRLLEIESYRLVALLALPVARELSPIMSAAEAELAGISLAMSTQTTAEEPRLLDRLTRLEAQIQQRHIATSNRFSASDAYYRLIQRRIEELREQRIGGLQTFREFVERRLAPAMNTTMSISSRQEKLAQRVAQATQLLSTRVEIARQVQSQAVLASMDRRVALQLRLQQTVEGLSVAAITYYVVGLIGYLAKGLPGLGNTLKPEVIVAVSVPVVAGLVALGVRHLRKEIEAPSRGVAAAKTADGEEIGHH